MPIAHHKAAREHQRDATGRGQLLRLAVVRAAGADDVLDLPTLTRGDRQVRNLPPRATRRLAGERGGERICLNRRVCHGASIAWLAAWLYLRRFHARRIT